MNDPLLVQTLLSVQDDVKRLIEEVGSLKATVASYPQTQKEFNHMQGRYSVVSTLWAAFAGICSSIVASIWTHYHQG